METQSLPRAQIDGAEVTYREQGVGEPVVLIHGALPGAFLPLLSEPALADYFRLITYNRRGYGGSTAPATAMSISAHAADCRALLRHLGIARAHIVGHSFGAIVAFQLALDAPDTVGSLALLEPALPEVLLGSVEFGAAMAEVMPRYQAGDRAGAIDAFLGGACGPDYRRTLDAVLPTEFTQTVAAADTLFQVDLPALQAWGIGRADAARVGQPVLTVVGANSGPIFEAIDARMRSWLPQAEACVLPGATHLLMVQNPREMAGALAGFLARHPLTAVAE